MTKLKTITLAAISTFAIGGAAITTAEAQPFARHYSDNRLTTSYVDGLQWKINNAVQRGIISRNQARDLRDQVRRVQPLAWRVQTGHASPGEVQRLSNVVDRVDRLTSSYAANRPYRRPYY